MFACVRRTGAAGLGDARILVRSDGGIERGFVVIVCRACPEPQCAKVCPSQALERRPGGGVKLVSEKCLGCQNCVEACPFGAVFWDEESNKPDICIYCGYCADWCPHGVLALEKTEVPHAS
jgi:Fe-S-cluster-containing dehydrogenase component